MTPNDKLRLCQVILKTNDRRSLGFYVDREIETCVAACPKLEAAGIVGRSTQRIKEWAEKHCYEAPFRIRPSPAAAAGDGCHPAG